MTAPRALPLLLCALVRAAAVASPAAASPLPSVDLDGDGKPEVLRQTDEGLHLAGVVLPCGSEGFPCELDVLDVNSGDKLKELAVCARGPRDERTCELWAVVGGEAVQRPLPGRPGLDADGRLWPSALKASGNGILLAEEEGRFYTKVHKLVWEKGAFTYVAQPFFEAGGRAVKVDRSFPLTLRPDGGPVVANVKPASEVRWLLEDAGRPDVILLKTSTGLVGWTTLEALRQASDEVAMILGAG